MNRDLTDPQGAGPAEEHFAIVYAPKPGRKRFPENCVTLVTDAGQALTGADPEQSLRAARVFGPSRSSEGLRLYYLIEWL